MAGRPLAWLTERAEDQPESLAALTAAFVHAFQIDPLKRASIIMPGTRVEERAQQRTRRRELHGYM